MGGFKSGLFHGKGRKEYVLGTICDGISIFGECFVNFSGIFVNGMMNGKGTETSKMGTVSSYVGTWDCFLKIFQFLKIHHCFHEQ